MIKCCMRDSHTSHNKRISPQLPILSCHHYSGGNWPTISELYSPTFNITNVQLKSEKKVLTDRNSCTAYDNWIDKKIDRIQLALNQLSTTINDWSLIDFSTIELYQVDRYNVNMAPKQDLVLFPTLVIFSFTFTQSRTIMNEILGRNEILMNQ